MKTFITIWALLCFLDHTWCIPLNDGCDEPSPCGANPICEVTGQDGRGAICNCKAGYSDDPFNSSTPTGKFLHAGKARSSLGTAFCQLAVLFGLFRSFDFNRLIIVP